MFNRAPLFFRSGKRRSIGELITRGGGAKDRTMFEGLFQPTHLLVILGVALLILGPKKIPELGKGIGEAIRGFKSAIKVEEGKSAVATPHADSTEE